MEQKYTIGDAVLAKCIYDTKPSNRFVSKYIGDTVNRTELLSSRHNADNPLIITGLSRRVMTPYNLIDAFHDDVPAAFENLKLEKVLLVRKTPYGKEFIVRFQDVIEWRQ